MSAAFFPNDIHLLHASNFNPTSNEDYFACTSCFKKYKTRGSLYKHHRYECGVEKLFACSQCNFRFNYKQTLERHILHRHLRPKGEPGSFICGRCGKRFQRQDGLTKHLKSVCKQ